MRTCSCDRLIIVQSKGQKRAKTCEHIFKHKAKYPYNSWLQFTVYEKGTKHCDEKLKKLFIIWYKDILCKRLLGLWNLYIMNKALKIHQQPESRAWLQGHDCAKRQNYEDTRCIIQMVSTSIQWLYRIRLHIYIKCRRNKHLQWNSEVLCDWV